MIRTDFKSATVAADIELVDVVENAGAPGTGGDERRGGGAECEDEGSRATRHGEAVRDGNVGCGVCEWIEFGGTGGRESSCCGGSAGGGGNGAGGRCDADKAAGVASGETAEVFKGTSTTGTAVPATCTVGVASSPEGSETTEDADSGTAGPPTAGRRGRVAKTLRIDHEPSIAYIAIQSSTP
jgi:hypothetical protein